MKPKQILESFEIKQRDNGEPFKVCHDSRIVDYIRKAHNDGEILPSDQIYRLFHNLTELFCEVIEYGEDITDDGIFFQTCEKAVSDYYHVQKRWVIECPDSGEWCNQVMDEQGLFDDFMSIIESAMHEQARFVGGIVRDMLNELLAEESEVA